MTDPDAAETTSAGPDRPVWPAVAVLTAATFWTVTAEMLPSALLPAMSRSLGVSAGAIGALVSAWAVTIAIVGVPLVRLTLRVPRIVLLTLSLAMTGAANLVTALAPDFAVALVGRVLAATSHGLFWAVVVSYVATLVTPERLGRALSIVLAGPTLAGLAGLPIAALITEQIGWRWVFAGLSVVLALTAMTLGLVLTRRPGSTNTGAAEPAGSWDRSGTRVALVAVGGGLVLVGHFAAFTYVTTLVADLSGLGTRAIPLVLLVLGLTGAVGVVVSGVAADRFPLASLVTVSALVMAGIGLLPLGDDRPAVFLAGTVVWGLAIGAFPPILQVRVLRVSSATFRPLAGSIVVTVLNLGIAAGAALGGQVLIRGPIALAWTAFLAAGTGTLTFVLGPGTRSAGDNETLDPVRDRGSSTS